MPLMDRLLDRLEDLCKQEDTQRRLRQSLLDPAAEYMARKLYKYTAIIGVLLCLQTGLILALLHMRLKAC